MTQKIDLICIGKAKPGSAEQALYEKYSRRCRFNLSLSELNEARHDNPEQAKRLESKAIEGKISPQAKLICLDEHGKNFSSPELANFLAKSFEMSQRPTFIIGGSHGLSPSILNRAELRLSFGRLVWPHLLIRGMLAEQIYRCQTILDHHPYHRD